MKNKYQKKKKKKEQISEKEEKKRTNHRLTVLLRTIKNQSKQKIQNGPLWSITRGKIYRDHLWKIYTLVT